MRLANRTYSLKHLRLSPEDFSLSIILVCVLLLAQPSIQPRTPTLTRTVAYHPVAPVTKSSSCAQPQVLQLFPTTNSWPLSRLPRQVLGFQHLPVPQFAEIRFTPHLVNLNLSNHHYSGLCPSVPHNLGNGSFSFGNCCSWLTFFSFVFIYFFCFPFVYTDSTPVRMWQLSYYGRPPPEGGLGFTDKSCDPVR